MRIDAPTWSVLKVIGNSYPAKAAVIMPFVGYLILFQQDFVRLASSWSHFNELGVPSSFTQVSQNFYLLYFGLFIFGVGAFIFAISCDQDIKRHADMDSFCIYIESTTTANDVKRYCQYIRAQLGDDTDEGNLARIISQSIESGVQSNIPTESRLFVQKSYYTIKDNNLRPLRWVVFISFVIGLTLLAIPSLIVFVKVCRMFFAQFF